MPGESDWCFVNLYLEAGLKIIGDVFVLTYTLRAGRMMRNKRLQFSDRRHYNDMLKAPFKDSNGGNNNGLSKEDS